MIILRLIILLLHFTLVPVAVGRLITYKSTLSCHKDPLVIYLIGFFGELSIMYVVNTLITFYQDFTHEKEPVKGCFTIICFVFGAMLVVSIFTWINRFIVGDGEDEGDEEDELEEIADSTAEETAKGPALRERIVNLLNQGQPITKHTYIYTAIFALILAFQLYFAYGYEINQWSYDDFDYVVYSVDNIANDMVGVTHFATGDIPSSNVQRMSVSWTTFVSYLSVVTGFDVATICHTYLTMILLVIAYLAYFYMSKVMFSDLENRMIFMVLLATAMMFGLYSHYSITFRILCAIWQGKAILSGISIPFLIAYLPRIYKKKRLRNIFPLFVVAFGTCSLTVMSTLLVSITAVLMCISLCIYKRKIVAVIPTMACLMGPVLQVLILLTYKVFSAL